MMKILVTKQVFIRLLKKEFPRYTFDIEDDFDIKIYKNPKYKKQGYLRHTKRIQYLSGDPVHLGKLITQSEIRQMMFEEIFDKLPYVETGNERYDFGKAKCIINKLWNDATIEDMFRRDIDHFRIIFTTCNTYDHGLSHKGRDIEWECKDLAWVFVPIIGHDCNGNKEIKV